MKRPTIQLNPRLIRDWLYAAVDTVSLLSFLLVTLFPAPALAFVDDVALPYFAMDTLIFSRSEDGRVLGVDSNGELVRGSVIPVRVSAYSSTVAQTDSTPLITASGTRVSRGTAAANFLPIGSRVRLGNHIYTIEDRMNARFNNVHVIDIWMEHTSDAKAFGVRNMALEVLSIPD